MTTASDDSYTTTTVRTCQGYFVYRILYMIAGDGEGLGSKDTEGDGGGWEETS